LARSFRIVPKKRGNRSTGSKVWGKVIECALSAAFLVAGCVALVVVLVKVVIPEWRVNHQFVEHTCVVLQTRLGKQEGADGGLYRPDVRIQYTVNGEKHIVWTYSIRGRDWASRAEVEPILRTLEPGAEYACWYDPADPSVAVLVQTYSWWSWLTLAIPGSFILIGIGGVVHSLMTWGKSAERRSAIAQRAAQIAPFDPSRRAATDLPYVPRPASVTDSPGTTLTYRLPSVAASGWKLFGGAVACVGWNGIVALFACLAISGFLEGRPDWLLTVLLLPFVAVGGGIIVYFLRYALVASAVGPTLVEISEQPLYPGKPYDLFVSQTGRLKMEFIEVLLACDEQATFHQGTNTRRECLRVFEQPVYRRERFEVRHGVPFEARCVLEVPAGTMHSFKSDHNEIGWKIIVKGDVTGWPSFSRSFPVIVCPSPNGSNGTTTL
jgi:hypothetical protein